MKTFNFNICTDKKICYQCNKNISGCFETKEKDSWICMNCMIKNIDKISNKLNEDINGKT